jgi:predicted RNase H-like HicB family nuclease
MQVSVELESEGRWVPIRELTQLPGIVGFGVTREEALASVEEVASQMLADERIEDAR